MRVVNFSEARNSLKSVIDQVIDDTDYTVIARRDAPDAVLMSLDSFNGLMETVHLLKPPANAAHLARSFEQFRLGQDRKTLKRINALIKDCLRQPFEGFGKPEPLK